LCWWLWICDPFESGLGNGRIQAAPPGFGRHSNSEALRILNERYARGEISDDDYRRMKNELLKQEVVR